MKPIRRGTALLDVSLVLKSWRRDYCRDVASVAASIDRVVPDHAETTRRASSPESLR